MVGIVEVGKTYEFKTLTFYFVGTVDHVYPTHVRITDAWQVFNTGANADYYGKNKQGTKAERLPDGTLVPLAGVLVVPWEPVVSL